MGKIISIANQKGGVGKTTTAINLAASLAAIEHTTLIIDVDPQSNSTSGLGIEPKNVSNSIYEVMVGGVEMEDAIMETDLPFLDLVPSHINLVGAEIEMIDRDEREKILDKAISKAREKYDFVIIDCPPSLVCSPSMRSPHPIRSSFRFNANILRSKVLVSCSIPLRSCGSISIPIWISRGCC